MKVGKNGIMNIDFTEVYDEEDDVYYVTFNTGEPSYCIELDDILLLEVGVFTNFPTGFRILNFQKNKVGEVTLTPRLLMRKIKETISKQSPQPTIRQREAQVEQALEKVLTG